MMVQSCGMLLSEHVQTVAVGVEAGSGFLSRQNLGHFHRTLHGIRTPQMSEAISLKSKLLYMLQIHIREREVCS